MGGPSAFNNDEPYLGSTCEHKAPISCNPNPENWSWISKHIYDNGYVLHVRYYGCTNFEGEKIMVYKGKYVYRSWLDPHFSKEPDSPIARFAPTTEGLEWAKALAKAL